MARSKKSITIPAKYVKTVVAALGNFGLTTSDIAKITGLSLMTVFGVDTTLNKNDPIKKLEKKQRRKEVRALHKEDDEFWDGDKFFDFAHYYSGKLLKKENGKKD